MSSRPPCNVDWHKFPPARDTLRDQANIAREGRPTAAGSQVCCTDPRCPCLRTGKIVSIHSTPDHRSRGLGKMRGILRREPSVQGSGEDERQPATGSAPRLARAPRMRCMHRTPGHGPGGPLCAYACVVRTGAMRCATECMVAVLCMQACTRYVLFTAGVLNRKCWVRKLHRPQEMTPCRRVHRTRGIRGRALP